MCGCADAIRMGEILAGVRSSISQRSLPACAQTCGRADFVARRDL